MDWMGALNRLREEMRSYANRRVSSVVKFGGYTLASALGKQDKIRGYRTGAGEEVYDYVGRRAAPFGIRSVPVADGSTFGVWVGVGGGCANGVIISGDSDAYGPQDLKEGEVALYSKASGTLIKIDKDGNVRINAASGADVIVNGGSAAVSRVGDDLSASAAFKTWAAAVDSGIATNTPPPTPFATTAALPGGMGTIHSGAAHLKG